MRAFRSTARALVVALLVFFVAAISFTGESSVRSGYPFLDTAVLRVPDIVYVPTYWPAGLLPAGLMIERDPNGAIALDWRNILASGEELRIWESTRHDAAAKDAVGIYVHDTELLGSLTVWHSGHTQDGRANVLHARIGQTLIVIIGALSTAELLRIADSLHRTSSSSLQL